MIQSRRSGPSPGYRARLKASAAHLTVCLVVGLILVLITFEVWYPSPLFELASGREIFFLILACDVVLGPLLTLVVFDVRKPRAELVRDIGIIAIVQVIGMSYGVWSLLQARPAYVVYNAGQFNVTLANEIVDDRPLDKRDIFATPSWLGPTLVSVRAPKDTEERNRITFSALEGGGDLFQMPKYFQPYGDATDEVKRRAQTPDKLAADLHLPAAEFAEALARYASNVDAKGVLPVVVRHRLAVAVVDTADGRLLGIEPLPHQP